MNFFHYKAISTLGLSANLEFSLPLQPGMQEKPEQLFFFLESHQSPSFSSLPIEADYVLYSHTCLLLHFKPVSQTVLLQFLLLWYINNVPPKSILCGKQSMGLTPQSELTVHTGKLSQEIWVIINMVHRDC